MAGRLQRAQKYATTSGEVVLVSADVTKLSLEEVGDGAECADPESRTSFLPDNVCQTNLSGSVGLCRMPSGLWCGPARRTEDLRNY